MGALVIWIVIWVVIGLLVGALASLVVQGEPPFGLAVDILASVGTMVVVGLGDYFILPLVGIDGGALFFAVAILEPLVSVVLVLWLLRYIKRRREE